MTKDSPFKAPVEEVIQGFAPHMKVKIYEGDVSNSNPYCILDLNTYNREAKSAVPIRYWNYDSLLLLHRLLERTLDRLSYWYFNKKQENRYGSKINTHGNDPNNPSPFGHDEP